MNTILSISVDLRTPGSPFRLDDIHKVEGTPDGNVAVLIENILLKPSHLRWLLEHPAFVCMYTSGGYQTVVFSK